MQTFLMMYKVPIPSPLSHSYKLNYDFSLQDFLSQWPNVK